MTALNLIGRKRWVDFRGVPPRGWDFFYATLAADGIEGALRYIDGGSESKQVTSAERLAAAKHGRKILLVDETATGDAWDAANDFAAGQARGRGALADAKIQGFGQIGIAAAADAPAASARQVTDAVAYATGFAGIVGKTWAGFYGFLSVLRAVRAARVVSWFWLAGSMPSAEDARWIAFWQDNRGTHVYAGVQCDINWRLDGPLPGGEDDMQPNDLFKARMPKDGNWVPPGDGTFGHVIAGVHQAVFRNLNNNTKLDALTAAVAASTSNPDITAEEMKAIVADAVAANNQALVETMLDVQRPQLLELFTQAVGAAKADELAEQVVELLRSTPQPEGATA